MDNLNWIDFAILGIFGLSILAGLARGLVREIISLLTLISAFIVATVFANPLASAFSHSESVQNVVNQSASDMSQPVSFAALGLSFGVLFVATLIVGALIGALVNAIFQAGAVGIMNRLLGGIFGFARGFLINLVLIFMVQMTSFASNETWQNSRLVQHFQPAVEWLGEHVSPALENIKSRFGDSSQETA